MQTVENPMLSSKRPPSKYRVRLSNVIAAVLILIVGIGIGNGRIAIGKSSLVRKNSPITGQGALDYAGAQAVYDILKENFDGTLDTNKLNDGLKTGLVNAAGDPHTEYLNAENAKSFEDELNGTFTGIGAELSKNSDNHLIVVAPIAGFPAEKAGLKAKDIIVEIDGTSATGLSVSEAVNKIRGPKDTTVKLKIVRSNSQQLELTITRTQITVPSIKTEVLADNIGYIQISRFSDDTIELAQKAATDFKQANVKGVIVDVRNNPGGLLDAAVDVASLWLPTDKTVLLEKSHGKVIKTYKSKGPATLQNVPTVVLMDEGSASASEILAAALRDNNAGRLVGVKSFGKGSVQQPERLNGGGFIKVTIAHWFTPNDKTIDKAGLEPDQKVERSDEDIKNERDPQKAAALQFLKK